MSEMKNTLSGVNDRSDTEKQKINELKNTAIRIIQNKTQKEKKIKNIISENFKPVNVCNRVPK